MLVEALTDNRNRTAAEVRHAFDKHDGNLGTRARSAGSSSGAASCSSPAEGVDEDELMLAAAEGGADDVSRDGSSFEVVSAPEASQRCARRSRPPASPSSRPRSRWCRRRRSRSTRSAAARKIVRLMDTLEDNDDVQDVFANFDIPERVLETVGA